MRAVFADTSYWIAVIHPRDGLHDIAMTVSRQLGSCSIVTSDMVLVEVLNMFAGTGGQLRKAAAIAVQEITNDPSIEVIPQTRQLFRETLALYGTRMDKEWSLTDCASIRIMRRRRLVEVLTEDHHFEQSGFKVLLKQ